MKRMLIILIIMPLLILLKPSLLISNEQNDGAIDINSRLLINEFPVLSPELNMIINIPARRVMLYEKGKELFNFEIAVGSTIYPTPVGPRSINYISWNPWWYPPDSEWAKDDVDTPPGPGNPLGPVKMPMGGGIMLHGTNKDGSVGRYASHGCMRMHNDEAVQMAWYIQKRLNGSDETLLLKYKNQNRTTFNVMLNQEVPVEIICDPVEILEGTIYIYHDTYNCAADINTEILDALIENGIDLTEIDADKLSQIIYPGKKYEIIEIPLDEILTNT